ncbi:MAG: DUF1501 domain-containing protein, partial [Planctomycetia bacterium]
RRSTNSPNAAALPEQTDLDARIRNDELAFRMEATAPEAVDLAQKTEETKALYGLDEAGLRAIEDKMHVHDLQATILRLMELDRMRLVHTRNGRPERPTLNEGTPHPTLAG